MSKDPSWWNDKHESAWERTKAALKRDWEQTKNDFSSRGADLDQSAGDTVKQAAGKAPIPPGDVPNPPDAKKAAERWEDDEPAYRYGVGARAQYDEPATSWNPDLETRLEGEWSKSGNSRTWQDVKASVRRAWDSVKK